MIREICPQCRKGVDWIKDGVVLDDGEQYHLTCYMAQRTHDIADDAEEILDDDGTVCPST